MVKTAKKTKVPAKMNAMISKKSLETIKKVRAGKRNNELVVKVDELLEAGLNRLVDEVKSAIK